MEKKLPLRDAVIMILNQRGTTRYALAKKMGANPQSFDQTLKGDVRLSTFFRLAEAMEVTPAELAEKIEALRP